MIAELQRKFIRISVLSILTVFTLIFLALAHFSTVQVKRTLDVLTRTVANAGSLEELAEQAGPAQGALYGGDSAFRLTTRTFLIWLDEEENLLRLDNGMPGVTESRAEELAREAAEEGRDKGWVSDYRYRRGGGDPLCICGRQPEPQRLQPAAVYGIPGAAGQRGADPHAHGAVLQTGVAPGGRQL